MKHLDDYKHSMASLILRDDPKNRINREMDAMWHNEWVVPISLQGFTHIRPQINPVPHNAISAGIKAYATLRPSINITRPGDTEADRERWGKIENLMLYHFMRSMKRRGATPLEELLKSAMLYDEIAVQVVDVDAQLALMGLTEGNRYDAIKARGEFIVNVHNPQNVHTRYSDLISESVGTKRIQTIAEFEAFWGPRAKELLKTRSNKENKDSSYVVSFDVIDFERRAVWARIVQTDVVDSANFIKAMDGIEVMFEEHDFPTLGWSTWSGASMLENQPEYQHHALLDAVYRTGAWHEGNLADTLLASEIVSYAAAPRLKISGPSDDIEINYGIPGNPAWVPPGHDLEEMQPPAFDQNLLLMADKNNTKIIQSTAPQIVLAGDVPAGSAFASIDALMKSGLQTYSPYKKLAERALEDVIVIMFQWADHYGKTLSGPIENAEGDLSFADGGFELEPDTFTGFEEVTITLQPDLPVDRQQQVTTASLGVRDLGWSQEYANKQLGENDPSKIFQQMALETKKNQKLANSLAVDQAQNEIEIRGILANASDILAAIEEVPQLADMFRQMISQLQQEQAQGQGQGAAPPGQGTSPNPENPEGLPVIEGEQFNPAAGGQTPAQGNPAGNALSNQARQ